MSSLISYILAEHNINMHELVIRARQLDAFRALLAQLVRKKVESRKLG
jgi:hypothetical protein